MNRRKFTVRSRYQGFWDGFFSGMGFVDFYDQSDLVVSKRDLATVWRMDAEALRGDGERAVGKVVSDE